MKKNVRYSIWATFNNKQQRHLENLKNKVNNVLEGPYFPIHMTLCGELLGEEKKLIKKIRSTVNKLDKISIKVDNYGYKNTFFQSLHIKVIKNTKLAKQKKIIDDAFNRHTRMFYPHISLYYGHKKNSIKKRIISNLPSLKKEIKIKNLCLIRHKEKKLKWKKEKNLEWKIIKTFQI